MQVRTTGTKTGKAARTLADPNVIGPEAAW
jgi:hypothetical protein